MAENQHRKEEGRQSFPLPKANTGYLACDLRMKKKNIIKKTSLLLVLSLVFLFCTGFTSEKRVDNVIDINPTEPTTEETAQPAGEDTYTDPSLGSFQSEMDSINLGKDYHFGDEFITQSESAESFFQRIYNKLFHACNAIQIVIAIILCVFFVFCILMIVVSWIGNRNRVLWYVLGALVCAICFVADIYAVPILSMFRAWFIS